MRLYNYLNESQDNVDKLSQVSLPGKKPKQIDKTDWELFKEIVYLASKIKQKGKGTEMEEFQLKGKIDMLRTDIDELISMVDKPSKPKEVKGKYAKYIKHDTTSYDKFQSNIENIEEFLSTLDGFHKKAIKNLTIRFVDSKVQSTIAKYVEDEDILQINAKKVGKTKEEYGSLRYVILHELGHRYLKMYPQNWDIDDPKWITTKYSRTDSMTGEEKFAELFAISHWERKYKQFQDTIERFREKIK